MRRTSPLFISCVAVAVLTDRALAMDAAQLVDELTFEDLLAMNIQVNTAAKNNQKLLDTAAAVFVISADDLERFGVTTIPDALRMAPGVQVGQVSSSEWAVSIRGRNGRYSGFIQVLLDGRSIYDPLFGGVNWDEYALRVEDIECIEVVRGPGGVVWGANAVNGVINIVRKQASRQQGVNLVMGAGSELGHMARLSYGAPLGAQTFFSSYLKVQENDGLRGRLGFQENTWRAAIAGISLEYITNANHLSFRVNGIDNSNSYIGSIFDVAVPSRSNRNIEQDSRSYDVQLKWQHAFSADSWLNTHLSVTRYQRHAELFDVHSKNIDVDLEYTQRVGDRHQIKIGLNGQRVESNLDAEAEFGLTLNPAFNELSKMSMYVQDQLKVSERLDLIGGFRYDDYSDSDNSSQYSLRGIWRPQDNQRFWLGVSKAVTIPNRITIDQSHVVVTAALLDHPLIPPEQQSLIIASGHTGDPLKNTEMVAYELGWRYLVDYNLSLDVAFYHNKYDNMLKNSEGDMGTPLVLIANQSASRTGVEWSLSWKLANRWALQYSGSYVFESEGRGVDARNFFDPQLVAQVPQLAPVIADLNQVNIDENEPDHQHSLRLAGNLSDNIQMGLWWRYVDAIAMTDIDAYSTVDLNVNFRISNNLNIALRGHNLFADGHIEFGRKVLGSELMRIPEAYSVYLEWQY